MRIDLVAKVPYNMSHSAETEAVDLLAETDGIDKLPEVEVSTG